VPSNRWNLIVYRAWAPVYDRLLERTFRPGRARAAQILALQPGERVLLVGVGTGLDLPLLPPGVTGLGVDLSPSMLAHARRRASRNVELRRGDSSKLDVPTGSFDAAILNLVLSVVPDPVPVLRETLRALRPGGRAVAFDKFAPEGRSVSASRRALSALSSIFGTAVDRRLSDIVARQACQVVSNEPSIFSGQYRVVLLRRTEEPWTANQ
jgi:phosphatidylethanolamine/phosphatidyl-N-methylethanolamine N-methyltransferase